jgi:DNA-binding NtrC family response regulator
MRQDFSLFIASPNEPFIQTIKERLSDRYSVVVTSDGATIVNAILEMQPDLAILDFSFREIDILQLCEKLSTDYPQITTVISVSVEQLLCAKKKWRKRALDYILTPIGVDEFIEDVHKVVRYILIEKEREVLIRHKTELRFLLNNTIQQSKEVLQRSLSLQSVKPIQDALTLIVNLEQAIKELDSL